MICNLPFLSGEKEASIARECDSSTDKVNFDIKTLSSRLKTKTKRCVMGKVTECGLNH